MNVAQFIEFLRKQDQNAQVEIMWADCRSMGTGFEKFDPDLNLRFLLQPSGQLTAIQFGRETE